MGALPEIAAGFVTSLACAAFAGATPAQEPATQVPAHDDPYAPKPVAEDDASPWSLSLSVTATNAYIFRGITEEDRGVIVQPAAELDYLAHKGDGWLKEASLGLGTFDSFHSGPTGTGGDTAESPKAWYEADVYLVMHGTLDHGIGVAATWYEYTSPNSQFSAISEFDVAVDWDDGYLWNDAFKIHPSIAIARELHHQSEQPDDPVGTHPGTWLGVGIAPEFTLLDLGDPGQESTSRPVTLVLPVLLNLSLDHYYEDASGNEDTFGALDVGAALDVPLPFLPEGLCQWSLDLGLHWLYFGDNMTEVHHGERTQWVASAGISLSF
jgi:hypothetical protein